MKQIWIISVCAAAVIQVSGQSIMTTQEYISDYKNIAESEMKRTGVPAAISLAQGIVESNSGNGWLARNSNNHFGIKCKGDWTGPTVAYTDDQKDECFRKYDSPVDSWHDHSDFLRNTPRYSFLFQLQPTNYTDWAYGLKSAGYATNPDYAQKLIQTITDYNLQQYTQEAMGQPKTDTGANDLQFIGDGDQSQTQAQDLSPVRQYPMGIFTVNDKNVVYLSKGAALLPLADQYNIKLRDLVSYNDLPDDQPIAEDMLIFLEKKAQSGAEAFHIVQPGENMHDISQLEGIQLKWLLKRNKMAPGDEPLPDEKLYLIGIAPDPPRLMPPPAQISSGPAAPKPSLGVMVSNLKTEIRTVVNADHSQTPSTPMASEPDTQSPPSASGAGQIQEGPAPAPSRRQWPDTALAETSQTADTGLPSSTHTIKMDNPPQRKWPGTTLSENKKDHNYTRNGWIYHIVQPGETMYKLSKQFGVNVSDLKKWNHLGNNLLRSGQRLIIGKESV